MDKIVNSDIKFIKTVLMPFVKIDKLYLAWSKSERKWPDIQVELGRIPKITVTREWARQGIHERRKRLVHEGLHILGMTHDESISYSTIPSRDRFSMMVYRGLIRY